MITFNKLGSHGRLGNQLFQIASMYGIAESLHTAVGFPDWGYNKYFENKLDSGRNKETIQEPSFEYSNNWFRDHVNYLGWLQSEKYFGVNTKNIFKFNSTFEALVRSKNANILSKETIAISVRRGDYVGNPNYELLPPKYYIGALLEYFPNYKDYNIVFFSDDIKYCRFHFECLDNAYFSDGSDIEQLCLMSMCDHYIISNSTFSWWGAYLGETKGSIIIRPKYHFSEAYEQKNNSKDYYPDRWQSFDYKKYKINLSEVEFHIPVQYDHQDRIDNLEISLRNLSDFDTNIVIAENKTDVFNADIHFEYEHFHRTKILNELSKKSNFDIIVNWDADTVIAPMQINEAVRLIKSGADMVYPYDGRSARIPKQYHKKISQFNDFGIICDVQLNGTRKNDQKSVGHVIFWNRKSFESGGMENEKMISYAPEDVERFERFTRLGYKIERVIGVVGHLDHYVGSDSSTRHEHYQKNELELKHIRSLTNASLLEYVNSWKD